MPTAIILSQGDEVVTGQTTDTNAAWLATELTHLGFTVLKHVSVGDRKESIRDQVLEAASESALVLCTGGLGPTDDDLTAQAVSDAFNKSLALDPVALQNIEAMYRQMKRPMPSVNRKQAFLPEGSQRIDNHWGTAPGFLVREEGCVLAFMPGVPREMKRMFSHHLLPILHASFSLAARRLITIRTTGVGESTLQERLGTFEHPNAILSYRTKLPENHIKLRFEPSVEQSEAEQIALGLVERIGSPVFSIEGISGSPGGDLAEVAGRLLMEREETLAVAESCTGGRVCAMITKVPGSSVWFTEGCITYSNHSKTRQLGVPEEKIGAHGAVSEEVCIAMAEGIQRMSNTTYGLSTTGIAGPGGATPTKQVGTVFIGLKTPEKTYTRCLTLPGDRQRVQTLASAAALDLLRRHLQHFLT